MVASLTGIPIADEYDAAVFFSLAAFVAHAMAYRLPRGGFGDIAFIPLLSGVVVAPYIATVAGAGVAILFAEYFRRREPIRTLFNASQFMLSVGLAVAAFAATGGSSVLLSGTPAPLPFVAAFLTFFAVNASCFAGVVSVSSGERFLAILGRSLGGASVIYVLFGIPIVWAFAYAYVKVGWAWSGALLVPLAGVRQVYKANRELQTVNEELLQLMVAAIEARDPYTSGHSQRVAAYSRIVSHAAGLGARQAERVYTAALLHDVGKIHEEFAPILRKPGRLTDGEFETMKTHSAKGALLVSRVSQFADLVPAIRGHHEAWDGSGYPDGLSGAAIPQWARVIAVADTIDAMTTDRPYRMALTPAAVRAEVVAQIGRQFDPRIADLLTRAPLWPQMVEAIARHQDPGRRVDNAALPTSEIPRHSGSLGSPVTVTQGE
jgi:hypothetical protein